MTRAKLTAAQHAARHSRIAHLLSTTCGYCHAPAGEPCRSKSGTPIWEIAQMHNARLTPLPLAPNEIPAGLTLGKSEREKGMRSGRFINDKIEPAAQHGRNQITN
jgi:hypothetical protein